MFARFASLSFSALSAFAFIGLAPAPALAAEHETEQAVTLDRVPPAVRNAIHKHLDGATLKEIEAETEDGQTVYAVEAVRDGKTFEFEVSPDGKIVEEAKDAEEGEDDAKGAEHEDDDESISLDKAPPAVQAAVKKALGGNALDKLSKEDEDGQARYVAEFKADGVEHEVEISESGEVVEEEQDIDVAKLPDAVKRAVMKKHPGAKIAEAALKMAGGKTSYEVEITAGGKSHEVNVSEDGTISPDKADDDKDEEHEHAHHGKAGKDDNDNGHHDKDDDKPGAKQD